MVKEVILYIEGDTKQKGKGNAITLRQGFREFFQTLEDEINVLIRPLPLGSREETIRIFLNQIDNDPKSFQLLLVDSDTEIEEKETPKTFLQKISAKFDFKNVKEEQCHLMVQTMESWFLADKEKLAEFYGQGFNINALSKNANVEKIAKSDVETNLKNAVRATSKREYRKGEHAGEILRIIDSNKVRNAAPHCERLFVEIKKNVSK